MEKNPPPYTRADEPTPAGIATGYDQPQVSDGYASGQPAYAPPQAGYAPPPAGYAPPPAGYAPPPAGYAPPPAGYAQAPAGYAPPPHGYYPPPAPQAAPVQVSVDCWPVQYYVHSVNSSFRPGSHSLIQPLLRSLPQRALRSQPKVKVKVKVGSMVSHTSTIQISNTPLITG